MGRRLSLPFDDVRDSAALPPAWADRGACVPQTAALFFAPDGERTPAREVRERLAIGICARCEVRAECLAFAVANGESSGVWGGVTEQRLRVLVTQRARRMAVA